MDVQVEARPEPLHDRDRPGLALRRRVEPKALARERVQGSGEHPQDSPAEVVVPRHPVSERERQAQNPVPHGDVRQDAIDEVCRALDHQPYGMMRADTTFAR